MQAFLFPLIMLTYPARSGCIICTWFSSLLLSALSSWSQQERQKNMFQSITIFTYSGSLADHMASCLEAGDIVPTVAQQVADTLDLTENDLYTHHTLFL